MGCGFFRSERSKDNPQERMQPMERFRFAQEDGAFRVEAEVLRCGMDGCIWIYGGDTPHIGAVSVGGEGARPQEVIFPGHREEGIVRYFRETLLEKQLFRHCVICCGIHYDSIDRDGINTVVALCNRLCARVCEKLEEGRA